MLLPAPGPFKELLACCACRLKPRALFSQETNPLFSRGAEIPAGIGNALARLRYLMSPRMATRHARMRAPRRDSMSPPRLSHFWASLQHARMRAPRGANPVFMKLSR